MNITICTACGLEKELNETNFELRSPSDPNKYRKQCRDCVKIRRASYCQNNKEDIIQKVSIYYDENREEIIRHNIEYARQHPDDIKRNKKKFNTLHPESRREQKYRYRARKYNATIEKFAKQDVIDTYGDKCFYCISGNFEHLDHYIPLSKGGNHSLANVRPSCAKCNLHKNDKMPEDFIKCR